VWAPADIEYCMLTDSCDDNVVIMYESNARNIQLRTSHYQKLEKKVLAHRN